ncbi:hypothetical protein [Ornithinimicrobium kibberense]|uniref:hypothetical protein n=1 Tax=Ornithinimicrobium kibberense TaxID=282060 RepID=UPI00360F8E42
MSQPKRTAAIPTAQGSRWPAQVLRSRSSGVVGDSTTGTAGACVSVRMRARAASSCGLGRVGVVMPGVLPSVRTMIPQGVCRGEGPRPDEPAVRRARPARPR